VVLAKRLVWLLAASCGSATAGPFATSDQNPLLTGFALTAPARLPAAGHSRAQLSLNWSSTASIQKNDAETLVVDAESREWRAVVEHSFADKFAARVQLPYRTTDSGTLDSFIERFHGWFGMPNGDRDILPRDRVRIDYQKVGGQSLDRSGADLSGIGDVAVDFGYQLNSTPGQATSIWTSVLFPTGDADRLTGSEAFAASLAISHTRALGRYFEVFGHAGMSFRDKGDILGAQQRSSLWQATLGADYRATQRATITLQLDAHGAPFKASSLDLLGSAYILIVGGDYSWPSGWRLQFGISEDIEVSASPDVTFIFTIEKKH
jgi:hypothetical protein